MSLAILSITEGGALLAKRLAELLEGEIDVFAKAGYNPIGVFEYEHLGQLVARLFHQYDGLIFIMSVGMVVRIIAPHVRDKRYDPAVVAIDETSSYAISLLSGYLGGANSLTKRIGEAIGAQSIITTMADVQHKPAIDLLSVKLNAVIEPFEQLSSLNVAIANGERVKFFIDSSLTRCDTYMSASEEMDIKLHDMNELANANAYDAAVVITDKELYMVKPHVFLRPTTLVIGLDCKHGATSADILAAVSETCKKVGRSMKSIAIISTCIANEEEIGILATSQQLEVPVRFFAVAGSNDTCEAAAISAAKTDKILGKSRFANVAVAIAEAQTYWWE